MNLFEELDAIISKAVLESMSDEKKLQKKQAATVDKLGLRASDENQKEVREEEEDEEEAAEDEVKLKGAPEEQGGSKDKKVATKPEETGTAASKKLKDPSKKQLSKPTFKAIANNINLLRGGKSIKDPEVRKSLKDYLEKLSVDEKRQVLVYLNSLAQVLAGVKAGSDAAVDADHAEKKADVAKNSQKTVGIEDEKTDVIIVGE
tara:strand:- start:1006 stop:1617 length:612 start_codon:yes stop_codon:yes gene_type:complete